MSAEGLEIFVGNRSPSLSDVIRVAGAPQDLTTCSVKFRMRKEGAAAGVFKVDAAASITNPTGGAVRYDWAALDVDTAGDYRGWWVVTLPSGKTQDTPEFPITVSSHEDVPTGLLTSIEACREYTLRDQDDSTQDGQLVRLMKAYSRAVQKYSRREWLPLVSAQARKVAYNGLGLLTLDPWDLRSVTSIVMYTDLPTAQQRTLVAGSPTVEGEYRLLPPGLTEEGTYRSLALPTYAPVATGYSFMVDGEIVYRPGASYEVTVTGDWGIGTVPDDVELAVLIAVKNAYENPSSFAAGTVGGISFAEVPEPAPSLWERMLPSDSRALLTPYRRGTPIAVA